MHILCNHHQQHKRSTGYPRQDGTCLCLASKFFKLLIKQKYLVLLFHFVVTMVTVLLSFVI